MNTTKRIAGRDGTWALVRGRQLLLISTLTLLALALPLNAKEKMMQCTITKSGQVVDRSGKPMQNCMLVSGGKTYVVMDGKTMPVTKTMTMPDGTQCMTDGTCVLKSGKKVHLKEGQGVDTTTGNYFRARGLMPPGSFGGG
jgi:hypothetical protein